MRDDVHSDELFRCSCGSGCTILAVDDEPFGEADETALVTIYTLAGGNRGRLRTAWRALRGRSDAEADLLLSRADTERLSKCLAVVCSRFDEKVRAS